VMLAIVAAASWLAQASSPSVRSKATRHKTTEHRYNRPKR
jgi:hypothetical protein